MQPKDTQLSGCNVTHMRSGANTQATASSLPREETAIILNRNILLLQLKTLVHTVACLFA